MKMTMQNKKPGTAGRKAFTAVEILLAVAVVGILFGLIFAFYKSAINKAKYVEAVGTVDAISKAEEIKQMNTGEYVAAANTQEVNEKLGLDIKPKWYNYKVIGVTDDNFIVLAEKILDDINSGSLSSEPIVIAKDRSGPVSPESIPPTEGESTPPDSGSPSGPSDDGGGTPSGGGGGGGGTPSGGGGPGGGGRQLRYPNQTPLPASLLDFMKQAPLANTRYDLINDKHINMVYVNPDDYGVDRGGAIAWWYGINDLYGFDSSGAPVFITGNTIFVNQYITSTYTQPALASIISHEATHADYDYNSQVWIDATKAAHNELTDSDIHITQAPFNSIDQEFQADAAMVQLWNVVRDGPNGALDDYANHFAWGEAAFKAWLKSFPAYASLPNY